MKTFLFIACVAMISATVHAASPAVESIGCELKSGTGPFESVYLELGASPSMSVEWTDAASASDGVYIDEVIKLSTDDMVGDAYHFAANIDWGSGTLFLHDTEDGLRAFVTWSSDSNDLAAYYECRRNG